jgi:NCAIR mutase (PurE)-related protein
MGADDLVLDFQRGERIGLDEAIFCQGKTLRQLTDILDSARQRGAPMLLTRLSEDIFLRLPKKSRTALDYDSVSRTAFFEPHRTSTVATMTTGRRTRMAAPATASTTAPTMGTKLAAATRTTTTNTTSGTPATRTTTTNTTSVAPARVAIVSAGSSDAHVTHEIARSLAFYGYTSTAIQDVGVAGLWRLLARLDDIKRAEIVIVVAGMDAALPTVLGGLIGNVIIAVPSSTGYGVAAGGHSALNAMLASCAPGIPVMNIDNGYGAACTAIRMLRTFDARAHGGGKR